MTVLTNSIEEIFCEHFDYPKEAAYLIPFFFEKEEIDFIVNCEKETFTNKDYPEEFLKDAYQKGLVSFEDKEKQLYKLSNFYGMLDVFVCCRKEKYDELSKEEKKLLDDWYFRAYFEGLGDDYSQKPTKDEVLTLEEVCDFIDKDDRQIYLNFCDCRALRGDCGLLPRTCLTYRDAPNSFTDRGISEKISKEEAKQIVKESDKNGLMHTVNPNGICNCCSDCCYLFRSQKLRDSAGIWPATQKIIAFDADKCIGCGKCTKRCHFGIFEQANKREKVTCNPSACVGCGLCVNTCPTKALTLIMR